MKSINAIPIPSSITETKSLIDKLSYYKHFIKDVSALSVQIVDERTMDNKRTDKIVIPSNKFVN